MATRPPRTLAEQAAANLVADGVSPLKAVWKASQIVANLWALATTWRELGHMPTQREYCEANGINERTAERHWAEIKRAFPPLSPVSDDQLVATVTQHVVLQLRARDERTASLSVPALEYGAGAAA